MSEKIKKLCMVVPVIAGMVIMLSSCFPNIKIRETKYVSPNDQVALIFELRIRFDVENKFINSSYPTQKVKDGNKETKYKLFGL
jgi:hypothetical protein